MNNTVAIGARSAGALIGLPIVVAYILSTMPIAQFGLPLLLALPAIAVLSICIKMINGRKGHKRGVAPVLATLLMIAVAVAMSVIIFMWSQGFLSGTSGAAQSQTSQQNIAAQSSISIETIAFGLSPGGLTSVELDNDLDPDGVTMDISDETLPNDSNLYVQLVVRNVGGIAVSIGGVTINGAIHQLEVESYPRAFPGVFPCDPSCSAGDDQFAQQGKIIATYYGSDGAQIAPTNQGQSSVPITIPPKGFAIINVGFSWALGAVHNIKVTTTAGTFAQQVVTSPAD